MTKNRIANPVLIVLIVVGLLANSVRNGFAVQLSQPLAQTSAEEASDAETVISAALAETSIPAESEAGVITIKVNVLTDQWDALGSKQPGDSSNCSLREALQAAHVLNSNQGCGNPASDASEYKLDLNAGTHILSRADELPNITKKVSISGKGKSVSIDGGGSGTIGGGDERDKSIFMVKQGGILVLSEIILTNGMSAAGGAIRNEGSVTIRDSLLKENNSANLDFTSSGGAIYSTGSLFIEKTVFQDNAALDEGGAIWSGGADLVVKKSTFIKNISSGGGGAIRCGAGGTQLCEISETKFIENKVLGTDADNYEILSDDSIGGAIKNTGRFHGFKLSFEKNYTDGTKGGGAFGNKGSSDVLLEDSAFEENHADKKDPGVVNTFGGAIYNEGDLHLVRVSIHDNKATVAGGVFNRGNKLTMANVTISNNQATYHGGFANGSPLHNNSEFGIAYFFHVTHTENKDQADSKSEIATLGQYHVYLSNSIIDAGCLGGKFYTYGGNIFGEFCDTQEEPSVDPFADFHGADGNVGVQGLSFNGGPELDAGFYSQRLDGDSPAIDASRDGIFGCLQPDVNKRDTRNAERNTEPPAKCDSGAFEQGSLPPKFKAEIVPGENKESSIGGGAGGTEGTIYFRVHPDLSQTAQQQTLDISNDGGGSIKYEAILEDDDHGHFALQGDTNSSLLKGTHKMLTLTCTSSQIGVRYGMLLLKTDMPDKKDLRYKLSCVTTDYNHPSAAPNQDPGPISSGAGTPGTTSKTEFEVGNHSNQPSTVNATTPDSGNGVVSVAAAKQMVAAAGEQPVSSDAPITLSKGEKAIITISCTPPGPGLYFGTVQLASNDPDRPTMTYNVSCEGALPPVAEKLSPAGFYQGTPVNGYWGLAISPDGKQLLAGSVGDTTLQSFDRNPVNGALTEGDIFTHTGMSGILDIAYSGDGKFVYYSSSAGDGVVALQRAADGKLSEVQVITKDTTRICGINPIKFCKVGSMDGAFALDFAPDEKQLYVVAIGDHTLTVLARNVLSGTLFATQKFTRTIAGENVLGGAGDVLTSPDGKNVYVTSRSDDAVVVFTRDQSNGQLFYLRSYQDGVDGITTLDYPGNMSISSDGKFLYVPSYVDNAINVFSRAPGDGALELVQVVPNLDGVFAIDLSHDNENLRLVAALYSGDALRVYQRNRATGKLTFIEEYANSGGSPIDTPVRLIASADDKHVYTSLQTSKGVRLFQTQHAVADLFSFSPASVVAGSGDFTLGVNGSHFYSDSVVTWNGAPLTTLFASEHHLRATVPAANLAAAGNVSIKVRNASPGGGDSNALSFVITPANQAGIPSIDSITPPAISAGSGDLALLIKGSNFTEQTQVLLNNLAVTKTYINATTLLALILATDLQVDGPMGITVANPAVVNASEADATVKSKPIRFEAAVSGAVMPPSIQGLTPTSLKVGGGDQLITVSGYNFSGQLGAESVALWNGEPRTTIVVDSKTLLLALAPADLAKAGKASVKIYTPGVDESNAVSFAILNANDNLTPQVSSYAVSWDGQWTISINGNDFVQGAKVRFNGADRTTTFVSPFEVRATLSNSDALKGGLLQVFNPAPGGGASNNLVMAAQPPLKTVFIPMVAKAAANVEVLNSGTVNSESVVFATNDTNPVALAPGVLDENEPRSVYLPVVSR